MTQFGITKFMNFKEFLLLLASILASGTGQLFLKLGALKLGKVTADSIFDCTLSIVKVPELLLGLTCYGVGAIAYCLWSYLGGLATLTNHLD